MQASLKLQVRTSEDNEAQEEAQKELVALGVKV